MTARPCATGHGGHPSTRGPRAPRASAPGLDDERHLVDVAPRPVLTGLQRAHDRVVAGGGVLARVLVGGRVAAAHVAARPAGAQVHPPPADLEAVLTPGNRLRRIDSDLVQMGAGGHHPSNPRPPRSPGPGCDPPGLHAASGLTESL